MRSDIIFNNKNSLFLTIILIQVTNKTDKTER